MKEMMGRLSLRISGSWWKAYYALPNTMNGALLLGQIRVRFVQDERRKNEFIDMMRACVADIIEESTGIRPSWSGVVTAPEHEIGVEPEEEGHDLN